MGFFILINSDHFYSGHKTERRPIMGALQASSPQPSVFGRASPLSLTQRAPKKKAADLTSLRASRVTYNALK